MKCWETFFVCQPNPVLRSELITSMLVGTPLQFERVPTVALLDAVLLASTARVYCESEIVDDFKALCDRVEEEWRRPEWSCRVFSSIHGNAANFIVNHGRQKFAGCEEQYIVDMVTWYLGHDAPDYKAKKITTLPGAGQKAKPVKKLGRKQ